MMRRVFLIFHLRWMLFKNSLRTKSNWLEAGTGIFVALVVGIFDISVGIGLGLIAYVFYGRDVFTELITCVLAGISIMWLCIPVLTASFGDQMDAVRFRIYPLSMTEVLAIDLILGLVDPAGLLVIPLLVGLLGGVAARSLHMASIAGLFLLIFYIFNLALSRYVQRLIGSFFSTRRRKEILGLIVFLLLFVPQMLLTFNSPGRSRYRPQQPSAQQKGENPDRQTDRLRQIGKVATYLAWTPPGITARTIGDGPGEPTGKAILLFAAAVAFCLAAVVLEYQRVAREYSGRESYWQRRAARRRPPEHRPSVGAERHGPVTRPVPAVTKTNQDTAVILEPASRVLSWIPPEVMAMAAKDARYLYRSPRALLMFIAPLFACLIFVIPRTEFGAARIGSNYQIPLLVFYALFANSSQIFNNSFSFDWHGARLYFFSPVRGQDVLRGKNLAATAACLLQLAAVIILYLILTRSFPLQGLVSGLLILGVALPFDLTVGNYLSVLYPRGVDFSKVYGRAYSGVSAIVSLASTAVLFLAVGLGPLLAWTTGSLAIQYATLAGECALSISAYFYFLKPAGRLLEGRPEKFLQALLAAKQS